jgi:hypothetical protein
MENEEIVTLLKEIRDLQKVQIANNLEAVENQRLRTKRSLRVLFLVLAAFMAVNWGLVYVPALFNR